MQENEEVAVVMSTYNGEKWIKEQLDSIINQTYKNIKIFVRDDGSKDGTVNILKEYANKGLIILEEGKNIGYIKSFFKVLENAKGFKYYAFCDQDDIWMEFKIERAVENLNKKDNNKVLMYFSDYDYYDGEMNFKEHFKGWKKGPSFRNSIVDAITLGTCSVINENARKIILENGSEDICSHDWWTYFVCAGLGDVIYDKIATIKYRRHGNNVSACGKSFIKLQIYRIKNFIFGDYFKMVKLQILKFDKCFYKELSEENKKLLSLFTNKKYNLKIALKKVFYPKMFRQNIIDEIMLRFMFLIGKI